MQRFIIAAATLFALGGTAAAADLFQPPYVKAPVQAAPGWTGFYLGLNAGGGFGTGRSDFSVVGSPAFASVTNSLSGALAGGQVGYNWQTGAMVLGVEADFQWSGLKGSLSAPCLPGICALLPLTATYSQKVPWFGTVRGRVGYAGGGGWLMYATGGYSYARVDTDASATAGPVTASFSEHPVRSGWNVGGGVEVMLMPGWSAKMEYLHLDFGRRDVTWTLTGLPSITDSARFSMDIVRAGVNYRF